MTTLDDGTTPPGDDPEWGEWRAQYDDEDWDELDGQPATGGVTDVVVQDYGFPAVQQEYPVVPTDGVRITSHVVDDDPFERIGWSKTQLQAIKNNALDHLDYLGWLVGYRGLRIPKYWLIALWRGLVSLPTLLLVWACWVHATDHTAAIRGMADWSSAEATQVGHRIRLRRITRALRWAGTGVALTGTFLGYRMLHARAPWVPGKLLLTVMLLAALTVIGVFAARRRGVPIMEEVAPPNPEGVVVTVQVIRDAFNAAGLTSAKPDKEGNLPPQMQMVGVPQPTGPGTYFVLKAPPTLGLTFKKINDKTAEIASGMNGIPEECVEFDPMPRQGANVLGMFVSAVHPADLPAPYSSIYDLQHTNIFRALQAGETTRGEPCSMSLIGASTMIAGTSGMGKSTLLRLLVAAIAKDKNVIFDIADFAGGADFLALKPYAKTFIHGEDEEQLEQFDALLDEYAADYRRRMAKIAELYEDPDTREWVKDGRLTEAVVNAGIMRPRVLIVDEFQVALDGKEGEARAEKWAALLKKVRKAGMVSVAATQIADDAIPTNLRKQMPQRVCLSVPSHEASIQVTGLAAYNAGLDASRLGMVPGYGILVGIQTSAAPAWSGRVRFAGMSAGDLATVAAQVAATRGTPAMATGPVSRPVSGWEDDEDAAPWTQDGVQDDDAEPEPFIADILVNWPDRNAATVKELADALELSSTNIRDGIRFATGLRPWSVNVGGPGRPQGYLRTKVEAALAERQAAAVASVDDVADGFEGD